MTVTSTGPQESSPGPRHSCARSGGGRDLDDWISRSATVVAFSPAARPTWARRWADGIGDPFWGPVSRARIELATEGAAAALACPWSAAVPRAVSVTTSCA